MQWFDDLWKVKRENYYPRKFTFEFMNDDHKTLDELYFWSNGHFGCDTTNKQDPKFWIDDPYQQKRLHFKVGNTIIRNEDHSFGIE